MSKTDEIQPPASATPIVGSAEPLTRGQTLARLRELEAWGVDLSLVRANLQRTPEQRIVQNEDLARVIRELQAAMRRGEGRPLSPGTGFHRADQP
jgi:hypothetical protein